MNRRGALGIGAAAVAIVAVMLALGAGNWPGEGESSAVHSLAGASEADVPEAFKAITLPPGDAAMVAAGRQIAEKRCIVCHAADFKGKEIGGNRSTDLTKSAATRSEQFLYWAISEGSRSGMPAWNALPEEQRLQLVAFIKSLKEE